MDRMAPPMKDKPVHFLLPQMRDALDASEAAGSVLSAVGDGSLTPDRRHAGYGPHRQLQTHSLTCAPIVLSGEIPRRFIPAIFAAICVLPTNEYFTPSSRRCSPNVGSPTRSGAPFMVEP